MLKWIKTLPGRWYYKFLKSIYSRKSSLVIEYQDTDFKFDTSTRQSNSWFLPRYRGGKLHEPEISKFLIQEIEKDDVFYDVGAHVGYYSVLAAQKCTNGKVYSFEIDPALIESIKNHISLNNFENVKIVNSAVSDKTGKMISFAPENEGELSTNAIKNQGDVLVQTLALRDFIKQFDKPNFIKIDVEGNEKSVLEGLFRNKVEKLNKMLVEIHPDQLSKQDKKDIEDLILEKDFQVKIIDHREGKGVENRISNLEKNSMVYCWR